MEIADMIVIGSGQGGVTLAADFAKIGKNVGYRTGCPQCRRARHIGRQNRNRHCNIVQAGLEKNKEKPIQTLVIEANGRITFPQMTTGTYF